jgi:hypothetical protein
MMISIKPARRRPAGWWRQRMGPVCFPAGTMIDVGGLGIYGGERTHARRQHTSERYVGRQTSPAGTDARARASCCCCCTFSLMATDGDDGGMACVVLLEFVFR